jgi:hypothetical protein
MFDVSEMLSGLSKRYLIATSLVMEPLEKEPGCWSIRILAQRIPRSPTEALNAATGRPNVVTWETTWRETSAYDLPSSIYRGCWELEIAILDMLEQLALPA